MKKAIVIGSGLGGLQVALNLQRAGYMVTVLERDIRIGGCLQSFRRGNTYFDTGFHYVGGLLEGQALHELFKGYGLMDLPWKRMDEDCFDEVIIGDTHYRYPQGFDAFEARMTEYFPHEAEGIKKLVDLYRYVGEHTLDHRTDLNPLLATSAWEWLKETIHDPRCIQVLSGTAFKMHLDRDTLPLYIFAQINSTFIQSAWRLNGGGGMIAERLRDQLAEAGGTTRVRARVTRIHVEENKVVSVEVNGKETIACDLLVSDIHPASTLALLDEGAVRGIYKRRISGLRNSYGAFTTYIRLKPDTIPYHNYNIYVHGEHSDTWSPCLSANGKPIIGHVLVHFYPDQNAIDLLTAVDNALFEPWADKPQGKRGDDYVELKADVTEQCIRLVEPHLPGLRDAIAAINSSTPLTYAHYLEAPNGSAYGVMKDWKNPMTTLIPSKSPLENMFFTGQNLNLHGILGVSMTARMTTETILNTRNI